MKIRSETWDGSEPDRFATSLRAAAPSPEGLADAVAETIEQVRAGGDAAVAELGKRFDGVAPERLAVPAERLAAAAAAIPATLRSAIEATAANVTAVATAQLGEPAELVLDGGQRIEVGEVPVGSAAIYVPGGRAPYPSSVVMGVVPARVAGVERVVVASPPQRDTGEPATAVLAAAAITGADAVFAVGGAQAIAALAHGTESIAAVDVIAGPGSPWVQEAKLQCSRRVGIDGYAGPSELVALVDADVPCEWIALDLCAQAEHGPGGLLVAIGTDRAWLERLAVAVEAHAGTVPEAVIHLIAVGTIDEGTALTQALAPEHVEVIASDPAVAAGLTTAGCVFIGPCSATAFGDYAAGSNHVLPTGGAGRFTGPLGPGTFRRRISRVEIDAGAAAALAGTVDVLARAEGFPLHGESATARAGAGSAQARGNSAS
ncbi:MAG TPA: histidinol dehydrogenase [Solirubrobacterales bacterium]|nr:histidinol dehydrogenase [Solirubrobacterales bacterium]